jgi:hypothetical protein
MEALRHFIGAVGDYYKTVYEIACRQDPAKRSLSNKAQVVKEFLDANPTEKQLPESYVRAVAQTRLKYLQVAALSKNASFIEEKEWRLVLPMFSDPIPAPVNPPQFRAGKTTLIPYVAHPTSKFPLVDVILAQAVTKFQYPQRNDSLSQRDLTLNAPIPGALPVSLHLSFRFAKGIPYADRLKIKKTLFVL